MQEIMTCGERVLSNVNQRKMALKLWLLAVSVN
jgi:hypothetical protein